MDGYVFLVKGVEYRVFRAKVQDSEISEVHAELVEEGTVLSSECGCR